MKRIFAHLNPTENPNVTWDYEQIEDMIPREVLEVTDYFNQTDYQDLLSKTKEKVYRDSHAKVEYLALGSKKSSKKVAVLHFNPFGNPMDENMQLRALYLYRSFLAYGLVDADGRSLPLISLSSPGGAWSKQLGYQKRRRTARGNFDAVAGNYLDVIKKLGFTELHIIGFSAGATIAAATAVLAIKRGFVVRNLALGEPANVINRSRVSLARSFKSEASGLVKAVHDGGVEHMKSFYPLKTGAGYLLSFRKSARINLSLVGGYSNPTFPTDLEKLVSKNIVLTIGYGGLNTICPPEVIKKIIKDAQASSTGQYVHSVEISNIGHAWADRLNLLATFYGYALSR